jgi:hypothetical protein
MDNVLDAIKDDCDFASLYANDDDPVVEVFGRSGDSKTGETDILMVSYKGQDYEIRATKRSK